MASGDVSKRIRSNIQRRLKSHGQDIAEALPDAIYSACDNVQNRIAEETLCLEGTADILISADQETYDFPDGMISERKLISDGSLELKKINQDKVDSLTRQRQSTESSDSTADNLQYYYKWGDQFGFLAANGAIPGADSTVTVKYWRYIDSTEKMSDTIDPIVNRRWLKAIEYGALADLTGAQAWVIAYETEFARVSGKERSHRAENLQVTYNSDYD